MADEPDTPEVAQIRTKIGSWLDQHHNTIDYDLTNSPIEFQRHSGTLFTGSRGEVAITIGFKNENMNANHSLDQFRSNFTLIALDRLPVPGLQGIPPKWQIYPQTPVSSFTEGVTLEAYDPQTQIMKIHVNTKFFAIYGSLPPEHPMGCGRAPPGTYLQVRRDIQCTLKLRAKLIF